MKTNLLLVTALLCLTFSACKKSSQEKKQVKLVTKITELTNGQTTVKPVTYDSRNHITAIGNVTYTWEGDNLVKITDAGVVKTITYSNGVPVSFRTKGPAWDDTYQYAMAEGRVNKRFGPITRPNHQFTYVGNNVTVEKSDISWTTTYIYNADKSPFCNARFKYLLEPDNAQLFSENSITELYTQFSPRLGETYSYLRDADGFPKSAIRKRNKNNDPDGFIYTDITYEYEMRDIAE